ncbi:MAG: nicotinate-nucleotide adenylyltransferase [Pseudomonadales bacterium]
MSSSPVNRNGAFKNESVQNDKAVPENTAVGVFGGSFDPVHFGHLRAALELAFTFKLQKVVLIPNGEPPHRQRAHVDAQHRVRMLELAVANTSELQIDLRELERKGKSFTVDTLSGLREELGEATPIIFGLGADAFLNIASWHRADELLSLAHLAVLSRPGSELSLQSKVDLPFDAQWTEQSEVLTREPCGALFRLEMTPLAISSTRIREQIGRGWLPRFLLPETVCDYIEQHELYR